MMRDPFTIATPPDPDDDGDADDPRETMRAMRPRLDLDWPYPSFVPVARRSLRARVWIGLSLLLVAAATLTIGLSVLW